MLFDVGAHFDFLDVDRLLFLAGFTGPLLRFVFVLAVVEDLADGRRGVGCDLDEIKAGVGRAFQCIVGVYNPYILTGFIDQANLAIIDLLVDPRALAGRRCRNEVTNYVSLPS